MAEKQLKLRSGKESEPLVIAGPCSAESADQLLTICRQLQDLNVGIIRAGVWKPRSRPSNFEGAGLEALEWIKDIKSELGLAFAIEVATPEHVEAGLKFGIDIFWIGARTSVNPFAVQELADSLRGIQIPVMIKNPINPDLSLWRGAIERVQNAGVPEVAAVHRGFSSFQDSKFRNPPAWQIPIELKSNMPEIPLICDPSHIAGKRDMIFELAQKALDLNYDGLMIETHSDPDNALSDAEQQITSEELASILGRLKIREETSVNEIFINQLEELREKIDQTDREIVEAIATRMRIVDRIGEYKKDNNVTIFQLERWKEILESRPKWGKSLLLNQSFVEELYKIIHSESIKSQTEIMNRSTADPE